MAHLQCAELIIPVFFSEKADTIVRYTLLHIGTGGLAIQCTVGTTLASFK
jgi:hypothetical protein